MHSASGATGRTRVRDLVRFTAGILGVLLLGLSLYLMIDTGPNHWLKIVIGIILIPIALLILGFTDDGIRSGPGV